MDEKKMTLEELVGWLGDNDVPYGIDGAGRLTVKGNLREDFRDWVGACKYTSLPDELICVEGDLWLERTSITSLGNLASVGWSLDLRETPIISLGNLTSVGGWLDLKGTSITSLGNLISVGWFLDLQGTSITSLGNLISVGGFLDLNGVFITSLDNLTSVGGNLYLQDTPLNSLGNLASVEGDLDLKGASITSLGNLTSVGWNLILRDTSITSLDNLPQVGDLHLDQSQLQLLTRGVLRKVTRHIQYLDTTKNERVTLSTDELEAILAENEQREKLNNTRENDVDWGLYDR